jgi:hypothetical protein
MADVRSILLGERNPGRVLPSRIAAVEERDDGSRADQGFILPLAGGNGCNASRCNSRGDSRRNASLPSCRFC